MNDFQFHIPTNIIFGHNAQAQIGTLTAALGKRALILYGSDRIEKNGLLSELTALLDAEGIVWETFSGITENPLLSTAMKACQVVHEKQIDVLLAVGGGSVIDLAKAVSIGSVGEEDLWEYYEQISVPRKALPLGVVLTMAATASEANCVSVLQNDIPALPEHVSVLQNDVSEPGNSDILPPMKKKAALRCPLTYPRFALMNPELTYTVPARQTAIGALDIFAHAFERYFHLGQQGTLRTHLCTAVMQTVIWELPRVLADPTGYDGRAQLMWAATMAHSNMIGFDGVYACHAMSHILTGEFGLAHGSGLAILMPAWCRYMADFLPEELAHFARDVWKVDFSDETDDREAALAGITRFEDFIRKNGLPTTLREAGITQCDCRKLAELTVMANGSTIGGNFRALDLDGIRAVFEIAAG